MFLYTFCLPYFFGKIKKSSWNKEEKTTPTMTAGVEKNKYKCKINEKFNHASGMTTDGCETFCKVNDMTFWLHVASVQTYAKPRHKKVVCGNNERKSSIVAATFIVMQVEATAMSS